MRFFILSFLLLFNFAFTSAQTYTFNMYETSGGDYTIAIDIQRKQIMASKDLTTTTENLILIMGQAS